MYLSDQFLIISLAAGFAFAHGNRYGSRGNHMSSGNYGMMGSDMMANHQGNDGWDNSNCLGESWFRQGSWNSDEHQKFSGETAGLRKQVNDKMFDINEAERSPDANIDQLAKLEKELIDIRSMIHKKAEKLSGKKL